MRGLTGTNAMGKKKKGKKKVKKKKKSAGGANAEGGELIPFPTATKTYARLRMSMVGWDHAARLWPTDGVLVETQSTRLYSLKKKIVARHGNVNGLKIWRDQVHDDNLLWGDMRSLEDLGIEGVLSEGVPNSRTAPSRPATTSSSISTEENEPTSAEAGGTLNDKATDKGSSEENEAKREEGADGEHDSRESAQSEDLPVINLIYDFKPPKLNDPLLLTSPRC